MTLSEEVVSKKAQEMFDIIDWFEQICLDAAFNDTSTLTQNYGLLAALSVTQARKMRISSKDYRESHALRRVRCAVREEDLQGTVDKATGKTFTAVKAAAVALRENQDVYLKEYFAQGEWEGSEVVIEQVNKVLFAMDKMIKELSSNRDSNARTQGDNYGG